MNEESLKKWFQDNADNTLRLNYELDANSIVFDLGGYLGEWSEKIYNKYNSNIYIFEPIPDLYNNIKNKFSNNNKVKIFNYGISDENKEIKISLSKDSSSFYLNSDNQISVKTISIDQIIKDNNIEKIDLIKINIEGDEYLVIQSILDQNLIKKFKNIQVQFHFFIPNAVLLRQLIREQLKKTHQLTYDYEFVWENWKLMEQ